MKVRGVFRIGTLALLLCGWVACNQVSGIREGKPYPDACFTVADCAVVAPECRSAACIEERCVYTDKLAGTPLEQVAGDCVEAECDGEGRIRLTPVPTDVPKDGNPCTFDYCIGITPAHARLSFAPCYSGPAVTRGIGACVEGKQACDENAMPTGPCLGEVLPTEETCLSIFDDDCNGLVNESGIGCACVPGTSGLCFGGPEVALGNMPCAGGTQICKPDGTAYGECIGQTLPSSEACSSRGIDDDCDGRVDEEGPDCVCGDGVVSNLEACDDENTDDSDGCTDLCTLPGCGDGVAQGEEECDDGNTLDSDACTAQCKKAICGDGLLQVGVEECDDANAADTDSCTSSCKNAICGDGFVRKGVEECDYGSRVSTAACQPDCLALPVDIFVKSDFACVLFAGGRAKCWGLNPYGELGLGDVQNRGDGSNEMGDQLPFLALGVDRTIKAMGPGAESSCALLDDETVKCWGFCGSGHCGLGDVNSRGDGPGEMGDALPAVDLGKGRKAKMIGSGAIHACAILDNDALKCWGDNTYGQLGQGDLVNRGYVPGQMGDALHPIALGTNKIATQISGGAGFQCAILKDVVSKDVGVKCWGGNGFGQLGLGDTMDRGGAMGQMGDALPSVDLGDVGAVKQIASTLAHTCVLLSGGKVKCWGLNDFGQLGLGDTNFRGDAPGEMGDALPFIDLGTGKSAVDVATGAHESCALLSDGTVKCWGLNARGQLGLGDKENRGDGPGEMGDALPALDFGVGKKVKKLAMGLWFSCVLLDDASVKCWGQNDVGLLGLGDTLDRGDDPGEMGDNLPAVKLR